MRISDWSSDVCSSDLGTTLTEQIIAMHSRAHGCGELPDLPLIVKTLGARWPDIARDLEPGLLEREAARYLQAASRHAAADVLRLVDKTPLRSEEHTSELQSLMRISYAVFCLKKK